MSDYNPDTSGTHQGEHLPLTHPGETMAEAIRKFPTAVREVDGVLVPIHGETSPEQTRIDNVAKSAGKIICADCGKVMPCPHGNGKNTFGY